MIPLKEENYWICVIDKNNLKIAIKQSTYGVKEKGYNKIKKLKEGDKILFYILGKKIGGTFKIESKSFHADKNIFHSDLYPYRVKISQIKRLVIKPFKDELIEKLKFIKNKKYWAGSFHGSPIINLQTQDYQLLSKYLED